MDGDSLQYNIIAVENIINCSNTLMTLQLETNLLVVDGQCLPHKTVWENHGCMPISGNSAHTPELQ